MDSVYGSDQQLRRGNDMVLDSQLSQAARFHAPFLAETQLLEMVASGCSLLTVLSALCRGVEPELGSDCRCAVSLMDCRDLKFQDVVAPSMPSGFNEAMRSQPAVCETGPCGRAARLKSQVIAADVELDPLWQSSSFRALALTYDQRSWWSTPILSRNQDVLGTLAVLQDKPAFPLPLQLELIAKAVHVAALAFERTQRDAVLARTEAFLAQSQRLGSTGAFAWRLATDEFVCSEQLCQILGFDSNSSVSFALLLSRVHPDDLATLRGRLERLRSEGADIADEFRLLMPDRTVSHVRIAARAIPDPQGRWDFIGAIQDVTQQRRCKEALAEARTDLAYAARVMSIGALSASIVHEIKQPLSGIITNAGACLRMLAADPPDVAGARETAKRTLRDGNRASDVVTRLRGLFSKKTVSGEMVDLNQLALEVLTLALGDLQQRRIIVRTELTAELPTVQGDRIQLHQVILNLILNAADAMTSVDDRPRRLKIRTERDDAGSVCLSVEDSGTGFAAHEARLFEPFYTTKSDGMGIGLSVSQTIVVSHGGRLWATANEGPGATFCFCIPCEQPSTNTNV
jgi:signal transduction histidine kinase